MSYGMLFYFFLNRLSEMLAQTAQILGTSFLFFQLDLLL